MKLKFLWTLMLLMGLVACSSNNTSDEALLEGEEEIVVSDEEEMLEEESGDLLMEEEVAIEDQMIDEDIQGNMQEEIMVAETMEAEPMADAQFAYYQVQQGDSLMLVSFKIYGDYRLWKNIYRLNELELNNSTELTVGANLKYKVPEERFEWMPEGSPYLIKNGDTLGKISSNVYKKSMYWKYIYDNNKPLIRDPNLIFAGFTVYYKELTQEAIDNYRSLSSY